MTTYEYALIYAAMEFHVFPLWNHSKKPAINYWPNEATKDPEQLRHWFEFTNKNIGIVTGEISGINVIDIDVKNGADGFKSLKEYFKTDSLLSEEYLNFETPRNGKHVLVKWTNETDVRNAVNVLGIEGVDIRGNGGFIVAPPSIVNVNGLIKSYRAYDLKLPITEPTGWMKALLVQHKNNQSSASKSSKSKSTKSAFNPTEPMTGIKQGERNNTLLRYASHLFGHGFDKGVVTGFVLQAAKLCTPVFPENEAQQVIDSAFSYKNPQQQSRNHNTTRINSLEDTL